ncbi:hypothetical protein HCU40_20745 (plasmid) [Pseudanabaena biceps]|nr:hypothetical protein [Pseudanabaena biceps]
MAAGFLGAIAATVGVFLAPTLLASFAAASIERSAIVGYKLLDKGLLLL